MSKEIIKLTMDDTKRANILARLIARNITNAEAARLMQISVRQTIRLKQQYREQGIIGIVHKSRGRPSNHAYPAELSDHIIELYNNEYPGWNFSHFTEKLEDEHNLKLSLSLVRKTLNQADIISPRTHKSPRKSHPPRPRREKAGELVQIDASKHDWFGTGDYCHLHGGIDDATGTVLEGHFEKEETNYGYQILLKGIIIGYGIPECLYTDYRTTFQNNQKISMVETLEGKDARDTRFAAMVKHLGINIISTSNPRAKGRIERLWGTFQDRLRNELIQHNITTIEEANRFLNTFIPQYNQRFASPIDYNKCAFTPVPDNFDYNRELALKVLRSIHHGSYIRYANNYYTITRDGQRKLLEARNNVAIYQFLDGTLHLLYDDEWYDLEKVEKQIITTEAIKQTKQHKQGEPKLTLEELSKLRSTNSTKNRDKSPWAHTPIFPNRPKEYYWLKQK